jgi:hypothetical protein
MDSTMIVFFIIVVGIPVLVGVGGDVVKRWIKLKERQLELTSSQTAEKAAQYAAHTERLEARMAVLETIATDPAERTAREIEALRALPPAYTEGEEPC